MIKVAMIGFGGIAQAAHLPAYISLENRGVAKVVAACDIDEKRFTSKQSINIGTGITEIKDINYYVDLEKMLESEQIDLIDICVPTFLHKKIAADMLKRGFNVLSEKPMALTYEDCMELLDVSKESKGKLMIAQCCRFAPHFKYLKNIIESGIYGKPISAVFKRLSGPPKWGWENWFFDESKSGGCILDMHIHDIDIIRFLFGEPEKVACRTMDVYTGKDIVFSNLYYPDLMTLAIGDWSLEGADFESGYTVSFEKATILSDGTTVTVLPRDGEKFNPTLDKIDGYEGEIDYLIDLIVNNKENTLNPPKSAAKSVKLIETLVESSNQQGKIVSFLDVEN